MTDATLGKLGAVVGFDTWGKALVSEVLYVDGQAQPSLAVILSWLLAPVALLMGISCNEALSAGALLGELRHSSPRS